MSFYCVKVLLSFKKSVKDLTKLQQIEDRQFDKRKTYVKCSELSIQPYVASQVYLYKSRIKIFSSSNIYTLSHLASVIPQQSNFELKILKQEIQMINDERFDNRRYQLMRMLFKKVMSISMM